MANKKFRWGMLITALAFAAALAGCEIDPPRERWRPLTSLGQLQGTWRGSYSETMTMREMLEMMEASGETLPPEMQEIFDDIDLFDDMIVTVDVEVTVTIDASDPSAKTVATSTKTTQTYSGGNIDAVWDIISGELSALDQPEITVDDAHHAITTIQDIPAMPIPDEFEAMLAYGLVQINESGTKIKLQDILGEGLPEIEMTKVA